MRFDRPRIGIAHQTVNPGDAIGNDIAGAYRLLDRLGYPVSILCENLHPQLNEQFCVTKSPSAGEIARGFDVLLYHHSVEWPLGEQWLTSFDGPVIVKYHNITPASFFERYSTVYYETCTRGRHQTERLAHLSNVVHWQADSDFNATEIRSLGVAREDLSTIAPFMYCDELLMSPHRARYDMCGPLELLFVGRRAPNKGHRHLLHVLASCRRLFPTEAVRLTIVGSVDGRLSPYYEELERLQHALGVASDVRWLHHVPDADIREVFATSHLYLNLSDHEGFCVPAIEAQALGLPVVTSRTTALEETVGSGQLVVAPPESPADYDVIAGMVVSVARDSRMRDRVVSCGFRNVYRRFTSEVLENRFLADISPWLRSSSS